MINVTVELPRGSRMEETDKVVRKVEEAFQRYENDIELLFSSVGSGDSEAMGMGGGSNSGSIYIGLVPLEERTHSTQEIIEFVRDRIVSIPGAEIEVTAADMTTGMGGLPLLWRYN